jgi:hypothetical protein
MSTSNGKHGDTRKGVDRRAFIAGIATAGAGAAAATVAGPAPAEAAVAPPALKVSPPPAAVAAADTGSTLAVDPTIQFQVSDTLHVSHPGSDYMVDVVRNLPIDYIIATPGSTFRGIQESFVNYGENVHPEWITVHHEEISAAVAHGYAKVAGKPAAIIVHDDVGCSTPRWRSTTRGAIASACSCSSATSSTARRAGRASSGITPRSTPRSWCAAT